MRFIAFTLLVILSPCFAFISVGIWLSSPGRVFYLADRVGLHGKQFKLIKFRTMSDNEGSCITSHNDSRVFGFGRFLRLTKLDEIPQLINIIKGEMSFFGPRPESILIVKKIYTDEYKKTLKILPGLVSPGSLFNYTHGHVYLSALNAEQDYIEKFLPLKMKLELQYLKKKSWFFDTKLFFKTMLIIFLVSCGKRKFKNPFSD